MYYFKNYIFVVSICGCAVHIAALYLYIAVITYVCVVVYRRRL